MAIDDNVSYELTGYQVKDLAQRIRGKADDDVFVGAGSAVAGSRGLVPAPAAGDNEKFLSGDGTWKIVSGGDSTAHEIHFMSPLGSIPYSDLPVASSGDIELYDKEYQSITMSQLVAMLMEDEHIVFVPENVDARNKQRASIVSWAATIDDYFDPTDPQDSLVYALSVDIHVSTYLEGDYDITLSKDSDSSTSMSIAVREGNTLSFVTPIDNSYTPGAFDDLSQLVDDDAWTMATTSAEAWLLNSATNNQEHLLNFLPEIIKALCQGKKIALKAAVTAVDGLPIVATTYVFDSFSLEPTQDGFSNFSSLDYFIEAIQYGLANLRLYGVGRFGGSQLFTLEFTNNGVTLTYR